MEEILNKDLFDERDLLKYSPDYNLKDIILRMQLRREMVKDTHNHGGLRNSTYQKKYIKKTKNCYKIKKEIVKLHTYFQNRQLQNKCILKDVGRMNKKIYSCNTDVVKSALNSVNKDLIEDDFVLYVSDSMEDQVNLVIKNDSEFKLLNKDKEIIYNKKRTKYVDHDYKKQNKNNDSSATLTNNKTILPNVNKIIKRDQLSCNEFSSCNEYKNDLQSLLIMMAINPCLEDANDNEDNTKHYIDKPTRDPNYDESNINILCESTKDISQLCNKHKSENSNLATLLNVQPLTKELHHRLRYITKKYFNKWKMLVNSKRENRMFQQRQDTLNIFFDKLAKRKVGANTNDESAQKAQTIARDYNTYRNRYKLQKHIIALQKAKLEEQHKVIEQLKYNNIVEASRQSLDSMREDIRKTYYEIDKHLKPKIKCLTNELKLKEIEEPSLVLHCLKVPQFIQRMEARAREREEKHAIIRERRKQMEEERIRMKQQAELEKAEMDKEAKVNRIKELREKRKREKIENIRRKQHAERMRALIVMADLHYEKNLKVKYGISPLRRLLEISQDSMEKAKAHYRFQLLKNVFIHWMWHTEDMWFERNYKAENFYRNKILNKCFIMLRKSHFEYVLKKQVAEDYYDLYVTQLVFRKFRDGIELAKKEFEIKWIKAVLYFNSNILFKTFTCWRSLPALNALKREQDARKLKWRQKVLLVVPDYKPPED